MNQAITTVGITGAEGYVGSYLCGRLRERGFNVVGFDCCTQPGEQVLPYRLGEPVAADDLRGIDILLHLAYDFTLVKWPDIVRVNVDGSRMLFDAASQAGVGRVLFFSTMAAYNGCKSMYGKAKLLIEQEALIRDGTAVRPGLVWGGSGGMVGALGQTVTRSRFVPVFDGGRQILHLLSREDLGEFVARFASGEVQVEGVFTLACDRPWTFRSILEKLAEAKGRKVKFVSVPWKPVYWLLKAMEKTGRKLPFRSDSLLSLMNQDLSPDFTTYHRLGLEFRDFAPA